MISEKDKSAIIDLACRYNARRILLFGSQLDTTRHAKDIDLAVEGVKPKDFFRFYGDLIFSLTMPVDLIDLSIDNKFTQMVRRNGVTIYDRH